MLRREADSWGDKREGLAGASINVNVEEKVAAMFQPDTILPSQYFDGLRRKRYLEGEKRLMLAVLEDTIACFRREFFSRDPKGRALFREAEGWILEKNSDWLFSFENICEVLDLDPSYVRQKLLRWRDDEAYRTAREERRQAS